MEPIILGLLSVAAAFFVLGPLVRTAWSGYDWDGTGDVAGSGEATPEIRGEVERYRDAIRAGTLCERCGQANAPDSRFCGECGRPLATASQPG